MAWSTKAPLLALIGVFAVCASAAARPNVLLIGVDDLRPEIAGPFGQDYVHTPNLVRLAKQGTTFTRAYWCVPLSPMFPRKTIIRVLVQSSASMFPVADVAPHRPSP